MTVPHLNEQVALLDYAVRLSNLTMNYREDLQPEPANYSVAGFELHLHRHFLPLMLNYYLPTSLFVCSSWISFLIPPDAIPGRMALLITLLLCLVNILVQVVSHSPSSDFLTPISIWLMVCVSFVIFALLQYGCLLLWNYICLNVSPNRKKAQQKVDLASLLVSTITFGILNFMFWYFF